MKDNRQIGVDFFRMIAAGMVVAIHTFPFASISPKLDELITLTLFRVAVPFFFMTTGFFLIGPLARKRSYVTVTKVKIFLIKLVKIYGLVILIYLPFSFMNGTITIEQPILVWVKQIVFDGTFYHLWYFPAVLLGVMVVTFILKYASFKTTIEISFALYIIGLLGDSWYGLVTKFSGLELFYDWIFQVSDMTRNGLFFAPFFLCLGAFIYQGKEKKRLPQREKLFLLVLFATLLMLESTVLHLNDHLRHDSMYFFLPIVMYFLYLILMEWQPVYKIKKVNQLSLMIYIIHPIVIMGVHFMAKSIHLIRFSLIYFVLVFVISYLLSKVIDYLLNQFFVLKEEKIAFRAEREISRHAISHNLAEIKRVIPEKTKIMAVVKANSYGADLINFSRLVEKNGIHFFAVATIDEGIQLRKALIKGDILILGYTDVSRLDELKKYDLIQSLVSHEYAIRINTAQKGVRCHLQIDTGMHRLGVEPDSQLVKSLYELRYLSIEGIYSHLGSSDSLDDEAIRRTEQQLICYCTLLNELKKQGITYGITHIQSSYGILNYPEYEFDYVRAGIILYGFLSSHELVKTPLLLKPTIQIKARLVSKRQVKAGEYLGYGTDMKLPTNRLIGVVSIGYADGLPRRLSNSGYGVYYQDYLLPQIGNICMDMMLVDLSSVENIPIDAEVIALAEFEEIALKNKTLTNEVLSQLGNRLTTKIVK